MTMARSRSTTRLRPAELPTEELKMDVALSVTASPQSLPPEKRYLSLFDSAGRKNVPMFSGLIAYFPDACAAVANHSWKGNNKHNPGEPLHHARGKSMDHTDCILRHVTNYEGMDGESLEVIALAWRAFALCQEVLERKYALTIPRGVVDARAFPETNSLVGPNGEQAPAEFK